MQFGDFVYLCSLCNSHRGKLWSFSEAWKFRYANGYKSKRVGDRTDKCYYCNNFDYLVDIFGKKHPNLFHWYRGHRECAYCKYDREVVVPRHEKTISTSFVYDKKYDAHTFGSEGSGSGINPDKALARVRAEIAKRSHEVDRRRAAYQDFKRKAQQSDVRYGSPPVFEV